MKLLSINKLYLFLLLKKSNEKNKTIILEKMKEYLDGSVNINRTYVRCPLCNNISFSKIHTAEKGDKVSELVVSVNGKKIKLGNNAMVFKKNKRIYYICDMYYHFVEKHDYVPRKWFQALIYNEIIDFK